ncbi:MAG: hypothetical protein PUG55_03860 [Bacillales bacterium]|nr:hypothetical protein [Bacillales bacterium]MDY6003535.1 hypothetical protein [Bacilli bacterium]
MGLEIFKTLIDIFHQNNFRIYMIGGTSRDYLLGKSFFDYDFVTDATPEQMKTFLPNANYRFEKFGSVRLKVNNTKVDITTLRIEDEYLDHRHPNKIRFTTKLEEDVLRRDFTINALYIDEEMNVIDLVNGLDDLHNGIIRFIGNPEKRIKEDPLRILRAERFKIKLHFEFEEQTRLNIEKYHYLINELNKQKIDEEKRKKENDI